MAAAVENQKTGRPAHQWPLAEFGQAGGWGKNLARAEHCMTNPVSGAPNTPIAEAIGQMRRHRVGSLPVVKDGRLVGIRTEFDFLAIAAQLVDSELRRVQSPAAPDEPAG